MVSRKVLSVLFWSKVLFSLCFCCTALAFLSLRVYTKHRDAVANSQGVLTRIDADANSAECQPNSALAINEPPEGSGVLLGYALDWFHDTPTTVTQRVNFRGAVWNAFIQLDPTMKKWIDQDMILWHASEIQKIGGMFMLTIEPVVPMDQILPSHVEEIAKLMHRVNFDMGVPVLLRYGHEMNGDWTVYGYKPAQYIAAFQLLATAVHARTNMTAMLWSPNVGINYPFSVTSDSTSPPPTSAQSDPLNFPLLDTNNDGVIDFFDDPYTPYYPGDDYVDWVGLSLYYYQDYDTINNIPPSSFFEDYLVGSGPSVDNQFGGNAASSANLTARNFYQNFAINHNKPLIMSESGAPYIIHATSGASDYDVKSAWWIQTWSTSIQSKYPLLKGILNFEEEKVEGVLKSWSQTNDSLITGDYRDFILSSAAGNILFANNLAFSCSGTVQIVE